MSYCIVSIDPAKVNIGIVVSTYTKIKKDYLIDIKYADRIEYHDDITFRQVIQYLFDEYGKDRIHKLIIENQHIDTIIKSNMRYIQGYFDGRGVISKMIVPWTHNKNIRTYKERKRYSINTCIDILTNDININNKNIILDSLNMERKKDDICDAFNQMYFYILKH